MIRYLTLVILRSTGRCAIKPRRVGDLHARFLMNSELDIANKLKEALITSCTDALYFSDNETHLIDAEYLLTVNAAKAIKKLNHYFGTPYKIRLEHDTKTFSTACTPLFGKDPNRQITSVIRTENNTKRSGKIDIAIYTESNGIDIPLCTIEAKGFNPRKKYIIQDLERNAEYFGLSSETGNSNLEFTFFIALHSYKGVWNDEKENRNLNKTKKRYCGYIENNRLLSSKTQLIDVITIRRGQLPDPNDPVIKEHGLQGDEDYHFVGVIVTSKAKNPTNQGTRTQRSCAGV